MDLPIVIPCFFHNADTINVMEQGEALAIELEVNDEEYDITNVTFYNINFILPHPEKDQTMIGSNGDEFRSPWPIEKVLKKLK